MGIGNKRGYSLISMLVAMVLLSVGVLALMRTTGEIVEGYGTTSVRTTALSIARGYLEELRTRDPATLITEAAVTVNDSGVADASGNFSRAVTVSSPQTNLRQVVVTVNFPRAARPIELITLVFVAVI
jgi:Tfp pilus assembly protein PilV